MAARSIVDARRPHARRSTPGWPAARWFAVVALLSSGTIAQLAAQAPSLGIAPEGGVTVPIGNFSHYVEPGPGFGIRLTYGLTPRVHLLLDGGYHRFSGSRSSVLDTTGPDMRMGQLIGGIEAELLPVDRRMSVILQAGAGAARLESDTFESRNGTRTISLNDTGLTTSGGLQLGYAIARNVMLFGDGRVNLSLIEQNKTLPLAHDLQMGVLKTVVTLPLQVGIRARL